MPSKNTAKDEPSCSGWGKRALVVPRALVLVVIVCLVTSCARAPLKGVDNAMRRVSPPPLKELKDDLPLVPFLEAIEAQIEHVEASPGFKSFTFGERVVPKQEYLEGLKRFVALGREALSPDAFFQAVEDEFEFYEVYGDPEWGDVFMTSYYEPIIKGSLRKTSRFTQPIYAHPSDMVYVDLSVFDEKFIGEKRYKARVDGNRVVPYFTREEIDSKGALKHKKLELFWVDPIDAFLLQIQGSGTIELPGGKRERLGYAEQNGHRYESVGKFLKSVIAPDQLSLPAIEDYLRSLPRDEMQQYLNYNPSYVFFRVSDRAAQTFMGLPATDGRTIATDGRYFPKGALAFLVTTKPRFEPSASTAPAPGSPLVSWEPMARFVLDQDVGGAIKGGGRLDLFWGRGDEAKRFAGVIKQRGKLYYVAPKSKNN